MFAVHRVQRLLQTAIFLSLASGCVTRQTYDVQNIEPTVSDVYNPQLGEVSVREVGDTMVEHSRTLSVAGFVTTAPINYILPGGVSGFQVHIEAGAEFRPRLLNGERFYCGDAQFDSTIDHSGGWNNVRRCVGTRPGGTYDASGLGVQKVDVNFALFRPTLLIDVKDDNLRKELIYTGRAGNQISVTYREYKGDLARPAFFQTLTFDLNQGHIFGFQGSRFEVVDASNTQIKYRIISPLN